MEVREHNRYVVSQAVTNFLSNHMKQGYSRGTDSHYSGQEVPRILCSYNNRCHIHDSSPLDSLVSQFNSFQVSRPIPVSSCLHLNPSRT
jgi:hypothetical protein